MLEKVALLEREEDKGMRARITATFGLQAGLGAALAGLVPWALWEGLLEAPYVLDSALGLLRRFALALA